MAKITLRDLAQRLDLHPSTVSRALDPKRTELVNEETRRRVQQLADELEYRPDAVAAGLRRQRTNTLGVVVADLANPFIAPVLRGMENTLEARDRMALITETQDNHDRFRRVIDKLLQRQVDAILTTAARTDDEGLLRRASQHVPVVLAVRDLPGSGLPAVSHDDRHGGRLAAEHLFDVAGRRLAQLEGPADISSFRRRAHGFAERAEQLGAELVDVGEVGRHPILEEGRRLMRALLQSASALPHGVFAHNDLMALGALEILRAEGIRVPEDVKLIGYNNSPLTEHVDPPLTTVVLPGATVGRRAAQVAVRLIDGPDGERTADRLLPQLIARRSTAPVSSRR